MQNSKENYQKATGISTEINRVASLSASLACLAAAYLSGSIEVFHLAITIVVLPLGCIWYGSEIGDFAAMQTDGGREVGNAIGTFIVVAGWVVLVLMLAIIVFLPLENY